MSSDNNTNNEQLTPDDLKVDDDIKVENNPNQYKTDNHNTSNSNEIYNTLINELVEIINKCEDNDSEHTLYSLVDKFKTKYRDNLIKNNLPKEVELELITKLTTLHNKHKENNNKTYVEFLFDIYELLPYFYHPENFTTKITLPSFSEPLQNKIDYLDLFKKIAPKDDDLNKLIDELIEYLYKNYNDYKSLYIENNLLANYPSRSVFISFKFICLHLYLYQKICFNQMNKNLFNESLSSISRILLQEASYYNQKFNNEFYNNAFSEFDFNTDDKIKRKLSMNEFEFLTLNLFKFLSLIIREYTIHIDSNIQYDFTSKEIREIFWNQVDMEIKNESYNLKTDKDIFTYTYYVILSFSMEILSFVYTNFLYFNKEFTSKNEFHFDSYDPFFIFTNDWKDPIYHKEFLAYILNDIFLKYNNDIVQFIEIFEVLCDLKNQYSKEYDAVYQKNQSFSFFIIQPMNSTGIASLLFMIRKDKKFKSLLYSPLYIFDIQLPLIASLLKTGHSLRYIAIEWLIEMTSQFREELVPSMKSLKHYSYDDIFNDILDFIGSGENDTMRRYVNSKLKNFINILSNNARYEFFDYFLDSSLTVSEDKNLNDDKISYFIQIIKNVLNDNLTKGKTEFFNETFLKKVISTFLCKSYEKIFIFEIIETIAQAMNFVHFAILKDKRDFKGNLHIYNKEYLYEINKHMNEIAGLVDKFVKSPDEEKYKTLRMNPNDEREDIKHAFNQKKNQCVLLLELINKVDNLVLRSLKELGEEKESK